MKYLIGLAIIGAAVYFAVKYVGENRPTAAPTESSVPSE